MKTNSILQIVSAVVSLAALLTSNAFAQPPAARTRAARIYDSGNRTVITNADSRTQVLTYTQGGRRVTELRQIEPSTQRFEFNPGSRARDSIMRGVHLPTPMPDSDVQVDERTGNAGPIVLFSIPF